MSDLEGVGWTGKPVLKSDRSQELGRCLGHVGALRGRTRCYCLAEQGPSTKAGEECFRHTVLEVGRGLPCLGHSGM